MPQTSMLRAPAASSAEGRYGHLFRPGYVHRDLYASPELFAAEMRHLFGSTWVYMGHESEIPQPNDFVMRTVGRRPVILCRKEDGGFSVLPPGHARRIRLAPAARQPRARSAGSGARGTPQPLRRRCGCWTPPPGRASTSTSSRTC